MNDTSPAFEEIWHQAISDISPEKRIEMACSMYEFAREVVTASINASEPGVSEVDLKKRILARFYGGDFDTDTLEQVARRLT